jgi:YfiH family protein
MHPDWLVPEALAPHVGAVMSAREGGESAAPYNWLNLGSAVGDDAGAVLRNRQRFAQAIGATPVFLRQAHGTHVVRLLASDAATGAPLHEADASVTTQPGIACTVLVADCLPVLLAAPQGRAVAAAHAGWRGLAGSVVEAALSALCEAGSCAPDEVHAWLGACIGPRRFEVGLDVLQAFGSDPRDADPLRFVAAPARADQPKWFANLAQLARDRLTRAGVVRVTGGRWCTVEDASRFFSYRRDGVTGRMAAAIWIHG